jgi:hypothetical protein
VVGFLPPRAGVFFYFTATHGAETPKHIPAGRPKPKEGGSPMKLKLDASGNAVLQDGLPVYVHDDGKEIPFDAPAAMAKIGELNKENKGHRERAEKAEASLKVFEGLNPEAARAALATVKSLDDKKLIDAGKVDEVVAEATKAWQIKLDEQDKAYKVKLEEKDRTIQDRDGQIYSLMVTGQFASSKFIDQKITVPRGMMADTFGRSFKVEDGKVVAYGPDGNKIYSRQRPGDLANFDEALEILVESYPDKEGILKGTGNSGSGATGDKGSYKSGTDLSKLSPVERMKAARATGATT